MADASDAVQQLTDTLVAEAALPKKSESDGQSAEGQPLPDLIAAAKFVAANPAGKPKRPTFRLVRTLPPGAV